MARKALYLVFLILMLGKVQTRLLVSDGVDHIHNTDKSSTPFLVLSDLTVSSNMCVHEYGFFPCANNIGGYIFQIVMYQYLLTVGEKFLTLGSKKLFNILGTGIFGASLFRVFTVFPGLIMFIVCGLSNTTEDAQQYVALGVAVYTGSSVLYLTLLWGMCVILGSTKLHENNSASFQSTKASAWEPLLIKEHLSHLKDSGVSVDKKTKYTAGIMLLSLIPYIIVQLANVFSSLLGSRIVILIALGVSALSLLSYFIYQVWDPWMQERSLEYSKYESLRADFLHHVHRYSDGKLINDKGEPNISLIKRLFAESDLDKSQSITNEELEALMKRIECRNQEVDKEYAVGVMLEVFDQNKDGEITETEFIEGCKKWIHEANNDDSNKGKTSFRKVVQPLIDKRRQEVTKVEQIMARILKNAHCETLDVGCLLNDDRKPDLHRIYRYVNDSVRLHKKYDADQNKVLSRSELKSLIKTVNFGDRKVNHDEIVETVMKDLDLSGDQEVSEQEFVSGVTKWLDKATDVAKCSDAKQSIDEYDKILWKEVDSIVYEEEHIGQKNYKIALTWAFNKSVLQVILGIAMLTFLSGPLISSTEQFSTAIGVPSFFITFVVIPIAMNARGAISAIYPASQKTLKTTSLTFSEIYGGVVMNNIMGMTTLLAIVYAKELTWDYSAEVLIVLVVCVIIGLLASLFSRYQLWTCLVAFSLYPFSLVMFYVFEYLWGLE